MRKFTSAANLSWLLTKLMAYIASEVMKVLPKKFFFFTVCEQRTVVHTITNTFKIILYCLKNIFMRTTRLTHTPSSVFNVNFYLGVRVEFIKLINYHQHLFHVELLVS